MRRPAGGVVGVLDGMFGRSPLQKDTLQGTNISPKHGMFEDDFPFPEVGYC